MCRVDLGAWRLVLTPAGLAPAQLLLGEVVALAYILLQGSVVLTQIRNQQDRTRLRNSLQPS